MPVNDAKKPAKPPTGPGIFQKLRGLRQYQRQQNYHNPDSSKTVEDLKIEELIQPPAGTTGIIQEPQAKNAEPVPPAVVAPPAVDTPLAAGDISAQSPKNYPAGPCQSLIAEFSSSDIDYLFDQSNATLQTLLLKNAPRRERNRILAKMPRKQCSRVLRSWAENAQKLDTETFVKAFHWLRRRARRLHSEEATEYPEIRGTRVLSTILDGLPPKQEEQILKAVAHDTELSRWLERDRGSVEQRRMLRRISLEASDLELAVLFAIPHYGRLLRHLLDGHKKLDILHASIDLAQLPQTRRQELQEQLFQRFPSLRQ